MLQVIKEDLEKCNEYFDFLHAHPEKSGLEVETSCFVQNKLRQMGYAIWLADGNGFIGYLDLGKEETLGIRAELDALPISLLDQKLEYGHACGHDAHMAMAMTVARIIARQKEQLNVNIAFLMEEGEEEGIGIHPLLEKMKDLSFKSVWGIHSEPEVPSGCFALEKNEIMAGAASLLVEFKGHGGHASRPDYCRNPLLAVSESIGSIRQIWTDLLSPEDRITMAVTTIHGGKALNSIPEKAELGLNLRFFDVELGKKVCEEIVRRCRLIGEIHRCQVTFGEYLNDFGSVTKNSPVLVEKVLQEAKNQKILCKRWRMKPLYSSESFSYFCKDYTTAYAFLGNGIREDGKGNLHTVEYSFHRENFPLGIALTLAYINAENENSDKASL